MGKIKIIGHRGARGLAPENTLESLRKALQYNVDELEFDLRVTKDGVVVLHHDPYITDPSGGRTLISQYSYSELLTRKSNMPTFEEVLNSIGHPVPLYIEVKPGEPTKPIIKIIKKYLANGWKAEYFRLGSYSQKILRELHASLPEIQKIVIEDWSSIRAVWRARQVNTKRLSMLEYWLWSGIIASLTHRGYEVYSFPPTNADKERRYAKIGLTGFTNNPKKLNKWIKRGLAGVVTDFPNRFKT